MHCRLRLRVNWAYGRLPCCSARGTRSREAAVSKVTRPELGSQSQATWPSLIRTEPACITWIQARRSVGARGL
jgi:hypothetical protein